MHPFGREEASSLEKLFVFFTQCLQRGEWALAQACVPQLREWQAGGVGRVQEILQAIVACPYQLRYVCFTKHLGACTRNTWQLFLELNP
ncbi:Zinc finger FYVE domain-containing protein 26 [Acipenser ruthenus]|uniref:Zinc finger FYVE domain-containing protein 26 n=1 Tax=Acipenser ruthenus TaxID=7906 RepID=A0A662YLF8_ACIRT|nr:Zinc finger FYVE domain-containing protein 26 [Acipenser ruthenus]